jgi:hypothetical protein
MKTQKQIPDAKFAKVAQKSQKRKVNESVFFAVFAQLLRILRPVFKSSAL